MRLAQNVLYVQTQGAYVHLESETLRIEVEGELRLRAPLLGLRGLVLIGRVLVTSGAIDACAQRGISVSWLRANGRFVGQLAGPVSGNVMLRKAQHQVSADAERSLAIARRVVQGKIQNCRRLLQRGARESEGDRAAELARTAERLRGLAFMAEHCDDANPLRGLEGEAARAYFGAFRWLVKPAAADFVPDGRTRRPPRDMMNATLSFLYALLRIECSAALEVVGLDPQVGFLHVLRSGRPALALDLMEELRPVVVDRLALALANLRQLAPKHFDESPGGGIRLNEDGRREVIVAYQKRKEETIAHPALKMGVPYGLLPHVQARILARHVRGDIPGYLPFVLR